MATGTKSPRRRPVRARAAGGPRKPKPGRQPTQPLAVLYREGKETVCAMLVHPSRPDTRIETAKGPHAALGALIDLGYGFGSIRESVPEWAAARVPHQCVLIGCASITSVPF